MCWERQSCVCSLLSPIWPHKNGPWTGTFPYQDIASSQAVLDLAPCVRISFPVSDSIYAPLFSLSMYIIWYLANPTAISVPLGRERGPSFFCTRGLWANQLPCISHTDIHINMNGLNTSIKREMFRLMEKTRSNSMLSIRNPL